MKIFVFLFCTFLLSVACMSQQQTVSSITEKKILFGDSRLYQQKDSNNLQFNYYKQVLIDVKMSYSYCKRLHGEFVRKDDNNFYFTEYDTAGNVMSKGVVYIASRPIRTDTLKSISPITLKITQVKYIQSYRLKRTDEWEYYLVDSILDSKITYKSDTVFSSKKLNQVDKVNPDSLSKSMLGTWYAHIFQSNSDYILLTKNNSDYSFDFTSTFNKDFSYAAQLRFIENKQERGLNQGQWILNPNKVLNVHFNNGIDQSFKIAYITPDIIILNLN